MGVSLIVSVIAGHAFQIYYSTHQNPLLFYNDHKGLNQNYEVFSSILAVFTSCFLIYLLIKVLNKINYDGLKGISIYLTIVLMTLFFVNKLAIDYRLTPFILATTIFFLKLYPYVLLMIGYLKHYRFKPQDFLYILPSPWVTSPTARPELLVPISKKEQVQLDKEAFELLKFFLIFLFTGLIIQYGFFKSKFYGYQTSVFPIVPLHYIPNLIKNYMDLSTLEIILHFFLYGLLYIFSYLSIPIAVDAVYRLLGFEPLRQFYNPFKSKSGADLYNRVMPYVAHSINFLFIFPIYKILKRYCFKKISYDLSVFLGIFIYGYFAHLIEDFAYFTKYEFFEILKMELISWFFFSILIFIVIKEFKFNGPRWTTILKGITLTILLGAMSVVRFRPMEIHYTEKLRLFWHLVSL